MVLGSYTPAGDVVEVIEVRASFRGVAMRTTVLGLVVWAATAAVGAPVPPEEVVAAAKVGDLARVRMLVHRDPTAVAACDGNGWSALHWAAVRGHHDVAMTLVASGAPVDVVGADGGTPLHWAAHHDDVELVERLLDRGVPLDHANRWGRTALHVAARRGCVGVARLLVARGADLAAVTKEGWTPLHVAARADHPDVEEVLLAAGADSARTDAEGRTAADLAWRRPPPIEVDRDGLDEVTGEYQLGGDASIVVWREGDGLRIREFAPDWLVPVDDDRFVCRQEPWIVTVRRGGDGVVTGLEVAFLRRTVIASRVPVSEGAVGASTCAGCHPREHVAWMSTRHGLAYWRLATDWARYLATRREEYRNVADPLQDARCIGCHSTAATVGERTIVGTPLATEGVGCEACHGAGGGYAEADVMEDRARFLARGGRLPEAATCVGCHRDEQFRYDDFRARLAHPGAAGEPAVGSVEGVTEP